LISKLVDGARKSFSRLALPIQLKLSPCKEGSKENNYSRYSLNTGRPYIALSLKSLLRS
jgi:hypothetical protein